MTKMRSREAFILEAREDISSLEKDSQNLKSAWKSHLRSILEFMMALAIIILLIRSSVDMKAPKDLQCLNVRFSNSYSRFKSTDQKREVPRKTYTFLENPRYLHEDMFSSKTETLHTLHHWIELSADGRGYVKLEDADSFNLGEPYLLGPNGTEKQPAYMVSAFHQLHCLSYLVQNFQSAFDSVESTQEVAHHAAHCFDYLRQSIMCAADTSLEGKSDAGPGWGSKHECTDYDALLAWANKHTVFRYRTNMPEEAVL